MGSALIPTGRSGRKLGHSLRQVVTFAAEFRGQLAEASTPVVSLSAKPFPQDEWRRAAMGFAAFCEAGGFSIH